MPPKNERIGGAQEAYSAALINAFSRRDKSASLSKNKKALIKSREDIWRAVPPTLEEFFDQKRGWFKEPLYPIQYEFAQKMIGPNPTVWDLTYDEGHAFWGKGGGKDRTIAKLLIYIVVKLLHMVSPQEGLEQYTGQGTIGLGSPIDVINVSKDSTQAKNVFFKHLKVVLKNTFNPDTGNNYFEEIGMDIREGKGLQSDSVSFPFNITCHSLNSKIYTGEGLNIFVAVADEIGAYPASQARSQLTSIRETLDSRFPQVGKLMLMSYKYADMCPMSVEYKLGLNEKRVFSSNHSTWEVNPRKNKANYARHYTRNPQKAMWTYECRDDDKLSGGYIKLKYAVSWALRKENGENPFVGDVVSTKSLLGLRFKPWFYPAMAGHYCAVHIDLAKGDVEQEQCSVGFTMVYPELRKPNIHPKHREYLKSIGISPDENSLMKGIVVAVALQINAEPGSEVQFQEITDFILMMRRNGVNIVKVTYDGWQSVGEVQRMNNSGMNADTLSIDANTACYDNAKDLIYSGLLVGYEHPILHRELTELIKNDKGKIDHPDRSWLRLEQEGTDLGSKDVSDCLAGASYTAIKEIPVDSGICF